MDKRKESIADIVAEIRRDDKPYALDIASDLDKASGNIVLNEQAAQCLRDDCEYINQLADRFEAAAKRERETAGNAAAMREALEVARSALIGWQTCSISRTEHRDAIAAVNAALAAPARNCDVGTPNEQAKRYHATGQLYHTLTLTNVLQWAQAPYKEAERK